MTERRFSEEEFALVLRRATELQARGPGQGPALERADGLTLDEMKAIASEVGISSEAVEEAALALRWAGGTPADPLAVKFVLAASVPGRLSDEDRMRVLQAIRDGAMHYGEARETPTGVEWSSAKGETTQLNVSVYTLEGRNEVRVAVDRTASAVLTHLFPGLGSFFLVVATASSLELSVLGGAALVIGGLGAGLALARTIWHVNSRRIRARARDILEAVTGALPASRPED
ncbi:MAG TPA: hypothetical protein VLA43_20550 [Longimicrobiales bacterium]|nr:hypothetical protein [Longimicrobiales bacterium]